MVVIDEVDVVDEHLVAGGGVGQEMAKGEQAVAAVAKGEHEPAEPEEGDGKPGTKLDKNGLDQGKNEYQKGNYEEAVKAWARSHQSIKYILDKKLYTDKPDQLKEVHDMEITVCNNMAQGSLKTGDWTKAVEYADLALRIEPNNAKALWRKASAHKALLSFDEAIAVLEKLLQVEPANAAAKALLAEVRQLNEKSNRKLKRMSEKVWRTIDRDPRVPPTQREQLGDWVRNAPARARELFRESLEWCQEFPARCRELPRRLLRAAWTRLSASIPFFSSAAKPAEDDNKKKD